MSIYPQILGVYSERKAEEIGTGATRGVHEQLIYWFARRLDDDNFELQPLNTNHLPSGVKKIVSKGVFIKGFAPENKYYEQHTVAALKSLKAKVDKGEELFCKGELQKAEQEFLKALMLDDQNAKANLGLGSVYCENKNFKNLKKVLDVLLGNDATFQEEQRHQFNTFGISLRKSGLLEEAVKFYRAALDFNPQDENLHFNLARALFESKDLRLSLNHLEEALNLNPEMEEAAKLRNYVLKNLNKAASAEGPNLEL